MAAFCFTCVNAQQCFELACDDGKRFVERADEKLTAFLNQGKFRVPLKVEPHAQAYQMLLQIEIKFPFKLSNTAPCLDIPHGN